MNHQSKISLILSKIVFFSIIFFPHELLASPCGNQNNLVKDEGMIFIATYDLKKNNITFGTNTNIFHRISDNLYSFNIFACTSGIFKLKKDDRKETSLFEINNSEVETSSYSFNRVLKDRTDKVATTFNVKDSSGKKLWPDGKCLSHSEIQNKDGGKEVKHKDSNCRALDRLSVQIDYREKLKSGEYDIEYFVIDKGRDRKYIFKLVDAEVIDTIFGKTETILVRKIIEGNKRNTLTWYAINHGFVPVKIEQYRKKTLKFTAYLTSYTD
ncbi:MAG: DUF3108 domain-containing protein [Pseudomonadota bacterium]|nr:DUF3108 domain-containing protein [Pseudomonadota bacterium]